MLDFFFFNFQQKKNTIHFSPASLYHLLYTKSIYYLEVDSFFTLIFLLSKTTSGCYETVQGCDRNIEILSF